MVLGQPGGLVVGDGYTLRCPNQGAIVALGGWEVCDGRTEKL